MGPRMDKQAQDWIGHYFISINLKIQKLVLDHARDYDRHRDTPDATLLTPHGRELQVGGLTHLFGVVGECGVKSGV